MGRWQFGLRRLLWIIVGVALVLVSYRNFWFFGPIWLVGFGMMGWTIRFLRNRPGLTSRVEASDRDSGCHGFGTPTPCLKPCPASRGRSTEPVAPREIGK